MEEKHARGYGRVVSPFVLILIEIKRAMNRASKAMAAIMLMMAFAAGCNKPEDSNSSGNNSCDSVVDPLVNAHDFVDLGLPNGILWATCNVGADMPEEVGDFFCLGRD